MRILILFVTLLFLQPVMAKGVYQTPLAFLNQAFSSNVPTPANIWITADKKQVISDILQHSPSFIRAKYWKNGTKTAWILNEVGKEKLITVGVVIDNSRIQQLKVLTFRESRGWEVKHNFFTRQFTSAGLNKEHKLDQTIDGISGATLSVRALKKIATIALYLESQLPNHEE